MYGMSASAMRDLNSHIATIISNIQNKDICLDMFLNVIDICYMVTVILNDFIYNRFINSICTMIFSFSFFQCRLLRLR